MLYNLDPDPENCPNLDPDHTYSTVQYVVILYFCISADIQFIYGCWQKVNIRTVPKIIGISA